MLIYSLYNYKVNVVPYKDFRETLEDGNLDAHYIDDNGYSLDIRYETILIKEIVDSILSHQNGNSCEETYNNRARLIIVNSDVFRYNTEL